MNDKSLSRKFLEKAVAVEYSKVAWFYDIWSRLTESKSAEKVLEIADIHDGENILEVACGTGILLLEIVKRNITGMTEGIDLSPGMLAHAQKRMKSAKNGNFHLEIRSAYDLQFEDCSFDLLVNNFMFDLLPEEDFSSILTEFRRVLKPGGRLVLSYMANGEKWYNKPWDLVTMKLPGLLAGCRPITMKTYVEYAGFENIKFELISQNTFPSEVLWAVAKA